MLSFLWLLVSCIYQVKNARSDLYLPGTKRLDLLWNACFRVWHSQSTRHNPQTGSFWDVRSRICEACFLTVSGTFNLPSTTDRLFSSIACFYSCVCDRLLCVCPAVSPSEDLRPESAKHECGHEIIVNATVAALGNQTSQSRLSSSD